MWDGSANDHAILVIGPSWVGDTVMAQCLFKALAHAVQQMIHTGKPPYPVERTLLVSGVLDAAMHARAEGKALATPQLEFAYRPVDFRAMREMGGSWKVVTEETPEPSKPARKRERV